MTDPIQSASNVEKNEFVLPLFGEYFKKIDIIFWYFYCFNHY